MPAVRGARVAVVVALTVGSGFFGGVASAGVLGTHLSIAPGPRTVHYRTLLSWQTRLTAPTGVLANRSVSLQERASGRAAWRTVRTLRTGRDGSATLRVRLTRTEQWRWYYGGDLVFDPTASPAVTVRVLPPPRPRSAAVSRQLSFGERVVQEAARFNGAPYEYGASGPYAFDCSGFTMYVFGRFGVNLPHNAQSQYDVVRHVPQSGMLPGDLVFFYDSSGYVYHVGIYAGSGRIWHANHSGGSVLLESLWTDAFWVGRV